MDSQKPSDASHEWRLPNVITSVASYKFCVKSSQRRDANGTTDCTATQPTTRVEATIYAEEQK